MPSRVLEMALISSFVPSEEIQKLTFGSYEHLKTQVESSIEKSRDRLFGSDAPVQVLGTFPGYAIVLSESEEVFRVKFEKTDKGDVAPISAEALSVPAYSAKTLDKFVLREAQAYVDAFLSGSKSNASDHLKNLVPLVKERVPAPVPAKISESFSGLVAGERGWKKVYTARLGEIHATVKEELQKLTESRPVWREKFRRLYDGSIPQDKLAGYRDLVTSDLKYLGERVDSLVAETEKSVSFYKGVVPALKMEQKDATLLMFESFSEDYLADLCGVKKALSEANSLLNGVDDFGKIYDVLANELHRYEVAGLFVGKMSRSLAENAGTEEG
jgi:hypothetical protein